MAGIGIIANPASGRDIRRLVSYATVIDNNEKVNIVKRLVLAAQANGADAVYFMPDTFCMGWAVRDALDKAGLLHTDIRVLDSFELEDSAADSTRAAAEMERLGVGCIAVLGGDGTSRAVAKGVTHTPILPLSTGTNNVYPQMLEGTVAGMAAAAVARMTDRAECVVRDKRILVAVNGEPVDMALIDAVLSNDIFAGTKAIWRLENLRSLVVTRGHPATIGFSAIAGCARILRDSEDAGLFLAFGPGGRRVKAPVAAGIVEAVDIQSERLLALGEWVHQEMEAPGMVALDGEREVPVKKGDRLSLQVNRDGPWRVLPVRAVERALELGMYNLSEKE